TARDFWLPDGVLTDYQRWSIYRICTRTLNLYHAGWIAGRQCTYERCVSSPETIEHIVWKCGRAQRAWTRWIPLWLGHYPARIELTQLIPFIAY
ncbi:RxLR effector protein, partial [Phytophthora megakarya]